MMDYERDVDGCRMQAVRQPALKPPPGRRRGRRTEQQEQMPCGHQGFKEEGMKWGREDGEFV